MPYLPNRLIRTRGRLHLPTSLLAVMLEEGWRTWPLETGGILLGIREPDVCHVTGVIGPGPEATHERYAFTPDSDWQANRVADAWRDDPATEYLGDWHTHPGGTTRFSRLDHSTAVSIASYAAARQSAPVMIVLALGQDASSGLAAAQLVGARLRPMVVNATPPEC